ncbi:MAG: ectoine/hydroxyectoine ABC transporter substrate-binding protein EhuB [Deltaproteobacteria bacterium]|nr:ectoine/hydroxyectoine ABC transporter substrate-binding protein EhuB [Deltaproteobacteria bacterium]
MLALSMVISFGDAANAADTLKKARKQGFIRVGFANEAPFGYATTSGKLTGEAPEIAKIIFRKLGIPEVDGVLTEWGGLIPGLKAGRFDVIAAGMFITPKRCREVAFSEPTYTLGQAFLVRAGNPKNLHSYDDAAKNPDVKLGVLSGAVEVGYARIAGIPDERIVGLPDQGSMLAAVRSGRVDAAALTALSIQNMAEKGGEAVERAHPFTTLPEAMGSGGFAFRKKDKALLKAFNRELKQFIGTKAHLDLVGPFGFTEAELPQKTAAECCASK